MEQKELEKKMPSTQAKASRRSSRTHRVEPLQRPLGLLGDDGHGLGGVEQVGLLVLFGDVGVDQQRVGLAVDGLDQHLHGVEGAGFGGLDVLVEVDGEVLVDDAVGGGEEGQHVLDEVLLVALSFFQSCTSLERSISSAVHIRARSIEGSTLWLMSG